MRFSGSSAIWTRGLGLAFLLLAGCNRSDADLGGPARVIDGDTLAIGPTHLRLVGIDAPESDQSCADRTGAPYPCGKVATQALAEFIGPDPVSCKRQGQDVYHRTLATCSVRGEDIQKWIVTKGLALAFTRYSQAYANAEAEARAAGKGVWAGAIVPPWDYRRCVRDGGTPGSCSHVAGASDRPSMAAETGSRANEATPPSPDCRIKGNINQAGERIYHMPTNPDYDRVVMRLDRGKRWFCSEEDARAAGWRPARP